MSKDQIPFDEINKILEFFDQTRDEFLKRCYYTHHYDDSPSNRRFKDNLCGVKRYPFCLKCLVIHSTKNPKCPHDPKSVLTIDDICDLMHSLFTQLKNIILTSDTIGDLTDQKLIDVKISFQKLLILSIILEDILVTVSHKEWKILEKFSEFLLNIYKAVERCNSVLQGRMRDKRFPLLTAHYYFNKDDNAAIELLGIAEKYTRELYLPNENHAILGNAIFTKIRIGKRDLNEDVSETEGFLSYILNDNIVFVWKKVENKQGDEWYIINYATDAPTYLRALLGEEDEINYIPNSIQKDFINETDKIYCKDKGITHDDLRERRKVEESMRKNEITPNDYECFQRDFNQKIIKKVNSVHTDCKVKEENLMPHEIDVSNEKVEYLSIDSDAPDEKTLKEDSREKICIELRNWGNSQPRNAHLAKNLVEYVIREIDNPSEDSEEVLKITKMADALGCDKKEIRRILKKIKVDLPILRNL